MGKKGMSRRDFLKSSVAGMGSFIYLSSNEKQPEERKETSPRMVYRVLGKTGIRLPVITMAEIA